MYYSIRQKREQRKINKKEKYFQTDLETRFLFITKGNWHFLFNKKSCQLFSELTGLEDLTYLLIYIYIYMCVYNRVQFQKAIHLTPSFLTEIL